MVKTRIDCSVQEAYEFDNEATEQELNRLISEMEQGEEEDRNQELLDFWEHCLHNVWENEAVYMILSGEELPSNMSYEDIPCIKKTVPMLNSVFDAFEEICRRLKLGEELSETD